MPKSEKVNASSSLQQNAHFSFPHSGIVLLLMLNIEVVNNFCAISMICFVLWTHELVLICKAWLEKPHLDGI